MTILHPDRSTPTATVMPKDPTARYQHLANRKGLWVILVTGEYAVEGRITDVARPNLTSDDPAPNVTLDCGYGSIVGPVLAGDLISAPLV